MSLLFTFSIHASDVMLYLYNNNNNNNNNYFSCISNVIKSFRNHFYAEHYLPLLAHHAVMVFFHSTNYNDNNCFNETSIMFKSLKKL